MSEQERGGQEGVELRGEAVRDVRAQRVDMARSCAEHIEAQQVFIEQGCARSIAGQRVDVRQGAVGLVRGNDVALTQGATVYLRGTATHLTQGFALLAGGSQLTMEQSASKWLFTRAADLRQSAVWVLAGGRINAKNCVAMIVIGNHVEGEVRPLLDARGAGIFGAVFGAIIGALWLMRGRRGS